MTVIDTSSSSSQMPLLRTAAVVLLITAGFFMPRLLPDGSVNAIHLQRLKDKVGNRSNASANSASPPPESAPSTVPPSSPPSPFAPSGCQ